MSGEIGLVKLKEGTDDSTWRRMEEFFISKGLFISSTAKGIMVNDIHRAVEEVEKEKRKAL